MRPLPRLHAITDPAVLALPDLPVRAAAIAALGSSVALHARDRSATARALVAVTTRFVALARPAEAAVIVNARFDIAASMGAHGVQLGANDPDITDLRNLRNLRTNLRTNLWLGASVHSLPEARDAIAAGADYLLLGNIFETTTHPGQPPLGLAVLEEAVALGTPVLAIGGITAARAAQVFAAGAWGVASISALWHAPDPYRAAGELLAPWLEAA